MISLPSFLSSLPKPIISLAPMDGITDHPMRYIYAQKFKPDIFFTEFVNVNAIIRGQPQVLEKLRYHSLEKPIIAQLSGSNPDHFYTAALMIAILGFSGIDINLGCPARTVVKNNGGSALIGKYKQVKSIIESVKKAKKDYEDSTSNTDLKLKSKKIKKLKELQAFSQYKKTKTNLSISVKTRIGLNQPITDKWISFLLDQGLDFITLHARTAKQGYKGQADWSKIKKANDLAKNTNTLIFGNGDIKSQSDIIKRYQETDVDGIMIGRGSLGNPWIFNQLNLLKKSHNSQEKTISPREKLNFMCKHASYFNQIYPDRFIAMRKHFGWYCQGFKQAKQIRIQLFQANNLEEVEKIIKNV